MRIRKQLITNIYIKDTDIKRLANGYTVFKRANKHAHALIPKQVDVERKIRLEGKLQKFLAKAQLLRQMLEKEFQQAPVRKKQPYIKRNMEYWAKGGNAANFKKNIRARMFEVARTMTVNPANKGEANGLGK